MTSYAMTSDNTLDMILKHGNVDYIHSKSLVDGSKVLPSIQQLNQRNGPLDVLLIDLTDTRKTEHKSRVKSIFHKKLGVYFDCDMLLATKYKNGILYTPIADKNNPSLAKLMSEDTLEEIANSDGVHADGVLPAANDVLQAANEASEVPNIAFYLNISYNIPNESHYLPNSTVFSDKGKRNFCKDPNIGIIFQVNLERSLSFGIGGSSTPDAKIVRISSDENSGGAGISLNDKLSWKRFVSKRVVVDGWSKEESSSAIAKNYAVDFTASNEKANILKTFPENNFNPETEIDETSGFTLGVTRGVEADKDGPKAKLEASAAYTQSRTIRFKTREYRMERGTSGERNVNFTYARETHPNATSILTSWTDPTWASKFPADLSKIQPMAYKSFVPKMDIVYKAKASETGTTTFNVDTSVLLMPIYHATYKHYYFFGGHLSYQGRDDHNLKDVSYNCSFDVDWEHAVFTGGRPVNLQTKAFDNICIDTDTNWNINLGAGNIQSATQSFIYDNLGRYVSAQDTTRCLDGKNLRQLQPVSTSLTQRWNWKKESNQLQNGFYEGKFLGIDTSTMQLGLYTSGESTTNTTNIDFLSAFTELFNA